MERAEKVAAATALREEGLSLRAIASLLGVHHATVLDFLSVERPAVFTCHGCGATFDRPGGTGRMPRWCVACKRELNRRRDEVRRGHRTGDPVALPCRDCGSQFERGPHAIKTTRCPDCTYRRMRFLRRIRGRQRPRAIRKEKEQRFGYGTAAWRRLRREVLTMRPACESCGTAADLTVHLAPALVGDHRGAQPEHCTVLCRSCHGRLDGSRGS
jgi:predicted Zn-ribbon and HTH transcriptional regulator